MTWLILARAAAVPAPHAPAVPRRRILQLIENLQQADLSLHDEARAYQELMDLEELSAQATGDLWPKGTRNLLPALRAVLASPEAAGWSLSLLKEVAE